MSIAILVLINYCLADTASIVYQKYMIAMAQLSDRESMQNISDELKENGKYFDPKLEITIFLSDKDAGMPSIN